MNPDARLRSSVRSALERSAAMWVTDPDSDVVWAGLHEGRWGIRMRQQVRDFTTVWFDVGERSVSIEAFLLPSPPRHRDAAYRLCLGRNRSRYRCYLAIDREGAIVIVGRVPLAAASAEVFDEIVGEVYELVEITFRPIIRIGFDVREKQS